MGKKPQVSNEEAEDGMDEVERSKGGKKSKRSKKKDYDEDEIERELEELSLEVNGELPKPKPNIEESEKKSNKNKDDDDDSTEPLKPTIGGGFAALMGSDSDNDGGDDEPSSARENKIEKVSNKKEDKSKKDNKSKRKSKRKGYDEDEDDIEELLAQIESEYTGEKREVKPASAKKEEKEREDSQEKKVPGEAESVEPMKTKGANDQSKRNEKEETKRDVKSEERKDTKKKEVKQTEKMSQKKEDKALDDAKKKKKEEISKKDDKKQKAKTKEEKKREEEEEAKARKGKPNKKMLEAMKQLIAKQKEEEERRKIEEEEKIRQEEERIRFLEEQRRLEEERKERQKQKQKDKMKRLKESGKLLTPKQKLEQKRMQATLAHFKIQGVAIPQAGEKPTTPTYKKQKKKKQEAPVETQEEEMDAKEEEEEDEEEGKEEEPEVEEEEEEDVVDAWDQLSGSDEGEDESTATGKDSVTQKTPPKLTSNSVKVETKGESDESETEEHQTVAEQRREKAMQRMAQRKAENEKTKSLDRLRSPVVCVLGHVDHGKTKILDKLRRTNVQEGEVGGITQQIGATNVPFESVKSQTRMVKDFEADSITLPGLLIIDTPGHESFSNLRSRGSSLCDIAILVIDITQGLEPQTIESISLLKAKKTPFVVALNKVDRVFEWESYPSKDIRELIRMQNVPCKNNFEKRTAEVIQALNMQGLNAALFWENPDPRSYVSLVPTSAISGDGMGNLMALITTMCQKKLANRLMFTEELQCTVLEVKTIQGHGTTIDVILVNGRLREGDTMILAGTECPIVTQIRSLLIPKPMKEIRVKGQYDELKEVQAALGVKIAARDLEKAIAGLNLQVAYHEDEIEILKESVDREFKAAMRSIKVKDKGVYVQASTLGALEALLEFFKANKVPYAGIRVGPVVKRDVMKAAAMLEHDPMYAVILAFDVKVERDAQELADKEGVKIFSEETIYHLGDRYVDYIKEYKKKKQDEFRHVAVFPCRLKILPDAIFNKRDPIVLGVTVDAGILRTGTPLCVPAKEFVEIGIVTSLEFDHKSVEIAKKGVNVCMKVEPVPGHTPKLFGRHFDAEDALISKISRESIDACKQYFRDDLGKTEWKLMAELKKEFSIL